MTCGQSSLERHPPVRIEQAALLHRNAKGVRSNAQIAQRGQNFRLRHDARAAAGQFAFDLLEDIDPPPGSPQHQAGKQPAHRAADDDRVALGFEVRARRTHLAITRKLLY